MFNLSPENHCNLILFFLPSLSNTLLAASLGTRNGSIRVCSYETAVG